MQKKKASVLFLLLFIGSVSAEKVFAQEKRASASEGEKCEVHSPWTASLPCKVFMPSGIPEGGVLFVHMLGRKKEDFYSLARVLRKNNFCAFAFDLPGHPRPLREEKKPDWREFGPSHFKRMLFDVREAWKEMLEVCGVEENRAFAVGAELGANLIINATVKGTIKPRGVVLLSPALSIKGLDAYKLLKESSWPEGVSAVIFTDTHHTYFLFSARKLKELIGKEATEKELKAFALGTYLLRDDLPVKEEIVKFFKELLSFPSVK